MEEELRRFIREILDREGIYCVNDREYSRFRDLVEFKYLEEEDLIGVVTRVNGALPNLPRFKQGEVENLILHITLYQKVTPFLADLIMSRGDQVRDSILELLVCTHKDLILGTGNKHLEDYFLRINDYWSPDNNSPIMDHYFKDDVIDKDGYVLGFIVPDFVTGELSNVLRFYSFTFRGQLLTNSEMCKVKKEDILVIPRHSPQYKNVRKENLIRSEKGLWKTWRALDIN